MPKEHNSAADKITHLIKSAGAKAGARKTVQVHMHLHGGQTIVALGPVIQAPPQPGHHQAPGTPWDQVERRKRQP